MELTERQKKELFKERAAGRSVKDLSVMYNLPYLTVLGILNTPQEEKEDRNKWKPRKVTLKFKKQVVEMYKNGKKVTDIANEFKIPWTTIWAWIKASNENERKEENMNALINAETDAEETKTAETRHEETLEEMADKIAEMKTGEGEEKMEEINKTEETRIKRPYKRRSRKHRIKRTYDESFKLRMINLHKDGMSLQEIVKQHGIPMGTLYGWISRAAAKEEPASLPENEQKQKRAHEYSPEVKRLALEKWANGEKIIEITNSLKIERGNIYAWAKDFIRARLEAPVLTARKSKKEAVEMISGIDSEELTRLRIENETLKETIRTMTMAMAGR